MAAIMDKNVNKQLSKNYKVFCFITKNTTFSLASALVLRFFRPVGLFLITNTKLVMVVSGYVLIHTYMHA